MTAARFAILAAVLAGAAGCVADHALTFTCDATHSCGGSGSCVDGACAFASATCASGLRFDQSASNGRAGLCASAPGEDMSVGGGGDGGDEDMATGSPDLTSGDMACTPAVAEDCFNGFDDDCNGMADCADPACQAIVECVPEAPNFQIGAEVASGSGCPTHYTASMLPVMQGLSAPTTCTGCSNTPTLACTATVSELNATCPGGTVLSSVGASSATCANNGGNGYNYNTGNLRVGGVSVNATCPATGTATLQPASWSSTAQFCQTTQIGAGCTAGFVCVAKLTAPAKHCVLAANSQSCPTNYSAEGSGPWYTGVTDTRACPSCPSVTASGGSCGTSFVKAYLNSSCTGSADFLSNNADNCGSTSGTKNSFQITLANTTAPTCPPPTVNTSGSATPTGPQTLCCE